MQRLPGRLSVGPSAKL